MRNRSALLLSCLFFMGCAQTENIISSEQAFPYGSTFSLTQQTPVAVGNLVVKLLKVEDSRCPMNVNCIRYGSAVTQVQLQDTRGNESTKILYLGDPLPAPNNRGHRSADTVLVSMGPRKYQLILTEVQPFPNTADDSPPEKTAKLEVRPL